MRPRRRCSRSRTGWPTRTRRAPRVSIDRASPSMTGDTELILALCEALMQAATMEAAVQSAVRHVGVATGAEVCGVVIALHGGIFLEAWHPVEHFDHLDRFQAVKRIAMQSAQLGATTSA